MFITTPNWEQWVPNGLGPEGCMYWRGMVLATELPWYLLTQLETDGEHSLTQTTFVSWETTLRSMLEQATPDSLLCIQAAMRSRSDGDWTLRRIAEVWIPSDDEVSDTGPLLFKLQGDSDLVDSHNNRTADSNANRRLLVRIPD